MTPRPTITTPRRPRSGCRAGLGLPEAIATLVVIVAVLGSLVLASTSLRSGSAQQQTRATLKQLRSALTRYTASQHPAPAGPASNALSVLLKDPTAGLLLRDLSFSDDAKGRPMLFDGYGNPIEYIGPEKHPPQGPDFVSGGADGHVGYPSDAPAALDDICGADTEGPMP